MGFYFLCPHGYLKNQCPWCEIEELIADLRFLEQECCDAENRADYLAVISVALASDINFLNKNLSILFSEIDQANKRVFRSHSLKEARLFLLRLKNLSDHLRSHQGAVS